MPSRSHPLAVRVEDQLNKLRTCEAPSSSPPASNHPTMETLCSRLSGLQDLYHRVDDLIQSPLTQRALARHRLDKWVLDEVLDGFLRVLDVCGMARDAFMLMTEHVTVIQSALRRRRGARKHEEVVNEVGVYISSRKKVKKEIEKCLKSLKRTENNFMSSPLRSDDQHLDEIVILLREVRSITIFIFEYLLTFFALSRPSMKGNGWSLFSKWLSSRRVVCEEEGDKISDFERTDASLQALSSCKGIDSVHMQKAQKGLEALDMNIQDVEHRLDCVFRCLIKTRVSLLNIFNC